MSELQDALVEGSEKFVFFKQKETAHSFARAIKECDGHMRFGDMSFDCDDGFAFTADVSYLPLADAPVGSTKKSSGVVWRVRVAVKRLTRNS